MAAPDFLVVGHLVRDLAALSEAEGTAGGWRPGGTALYAALVAARLGLRTAVLTSAASDVDIAALLPGVEVVCLPSPATTAFRNVYRRGRRHQYVRAVASPIGAEALPPPWREAAIVLLGPVIGEVDPALAACFPGALLGLSAQGWLRRLDARGRVRQGDPAQLEHLLPHASAVFASREDASPQAAAAWARQVPIVAYTEGERGARLWHRGQELWVPALPARTVDPTGAGDAFAAAFLVRWRETGDALQSGRFAAACASLVVEGEGAAIIPTRAAVEERLGEA